MEKGDPPEKKRNGLIARSETTRSLINGLNLPDRKSHSDDFAEYACQDAHSTIGQINIQTSFSHMSINHQALIRAGWDGQTCIGPGSAKDAISLLEHYGKLNSCGTEISTERKECVPDCYRCVACQEEHDKKSKK